MSIATGGVAGVGHRGLGHTGPPMHKSSCAVVSAGAGVWVGSKVRDQGQGQVQDAWGAAQGWGQDALIGVLHGEDPGFNFCRLCTRAQGEHDCDRILKWAHVFPGEQRESIVFIISDNHVSRGPKISQR